MLLCVFVFPILKHHPCPLLNISAISEQLSALCSRAVLPLSFTFSLSLPPVLSISFPLCCHPCSTLNVCADACVCVCVCENLIACDDRHKSYRQVKSRQGGWQSPALRDFLLHLHISCSIFNTGLTLTDTFSSPALPTASPGPDYQLFNAYR